MEGSVNYPLAASRRPLPAARMQGHHLVAVQQPAGLVRVQPSPLCCQPRHSPDSAGSRQSHHVQICECSTLLNALYSPQARSSAMVSCVIVYNEFLSAFQDRRHSDCSLSTLSAALTCTSSEGRKVTPITSNRKQGPCCFLVPRAGLAQQRR